MLRRFSVKRESLPATWAFPGAGLWFRGVHLIPGLKTETWGIQPFKE